MFFLLRLDHSTTIPVGFVGQNGTTLANLALIGLIWPQLLDTAVPKCGIGKVFDVEIGLRFLIIGKGFVLTMEYF